MPALALDYRPRTLSEVRGNQVTVKALEAVLARKADNIPHTMLFCGPSGCGKTTLARIVAKALGCVGGDFTELDIADFRGIDTAREIRRNMVYRPMEGRCRVFLLDECFAKGTLITTADNKFMAIENAWPGLKIKSMHGEDEVKTVFKNKVSLDRVIKIQFSDGRSIICSKEHEFFTTNGWVSASELKTDDLTFSFIGNIMVNDNLQMKGFDNAQNGSLLPSMPNADKVPSQSAGEIQSSILQPTMCGDSSEFPTRIPSQNLYQRNCAKNFESTQRDTKNRIGGTFTGAKFNSDEKNKSNACSEEYSKDERNKADKRDLECLAGETRRKWERNGTTNDFSCGSGLGHGICHISGSPSNRVSDKLQSGHCPAGFKIGDRSRWERASFEKEYVKRSKENPEIEFSRVDYIEVYQRGNNDQSFDGIIGDQERDQDFVIFYDLEVKNHPSYFAGGSLVHNCHKLTGDAQEALLKAFEDTPDHVYFLLATTDPAKLKTTVRNRCTTFEVSPLTTKELRELLNDVLDEEKVQVPEAAVDAIVDNCLGSPRNALQLLEKIIDMDPVDMAAAAEQAAQEQTQVIDLCRALMAKQKWDTVAKILKSLGEQEPESVRLAVRGYCSAILIKEDSPQAFLVADSFRNPFFGNGGKADLILACYEALTA